MGDGAEKHRVSLSGRLSLFALLPELVETVLDPRDPALEIVHLGMGRDMEPPGDQVGEAVELLLEGGGQAPSAERTRATARPPSVPGRVISKPWFPVLSRSDFSEGVSVCGPV